MKMRSSQKWKRVSWASDVNLCQIRLFLSEESPSQVGLGAQDNLQVKTSWILHSSGAGSDDQLPPGFEGSHSNDQLKKELFQIPLVKWKCPPKFVLNPHWQVVAGEENKEAEVQMQREMRVLEAIYPRPSAIPTSPSVSSELEELPCLEHQIPIVPLTPIEEEDVAQPSSDPLATSTGSQLQTIPVSSSQGIPLKPQSNILTPPQPRNSNERSAGGVVPGAEPDVVAAASAAFTAIMKSSEQGSLIDRDLLIKILHNPELIGKWLTDYGMSSNSQALPVRSSVAMNLAAAQSGPPLGYVHRGEPTTPFSGPPTSGFFQPVTNAVVPTLHQPPSAGIVKTPAAVMKAPVKDIFYYKSLIQQHGGEKPETHEQTIPQFVDHQHAGSKTDQLQSPQVARDSKTKNKKPCIYFNSSRGCKNGANCAYHHDMAVQQRIGIIQEAPSAKRMKIDREITGRTYERTA